jgi:DNA polymerase-3 subunit beta
MKLQVTQENLNKALMSVSRIASSRSTLPILANVLIKTSNNLLTISATNLSIAITHSIGAKILTEGSITVPARLMQDYISSLPSGIIDLEVENNRLKIKENSYSSTINGISADDYPLMPSIEKPTKISLSSSSLKEALNQVVLVASNDETRPILTGVLFDSNEHGFLIASTDSYRLAEKKLTSLKKYFKLLIPASSIQDLLRILSDNNSTINIEYDDNQIKFIVGEIELLTRLLSGQYPDYQALIPKSFNIQAKVNRQDMISIVKIANLFARETAGSIKINIAEGQVSINSIASQIGENNSSCSAKTEGQGDITLNAKYLLDALSVMDTKEIDFCFNGKLDPILIKPVDKKDYIHIIMPLKS